jgi:hypothetical protein
MSGLPSGTVTLFFTDVEVSTRLPQELGERYDAELADHHDEVRARGRAPVAAMGVGGAMRVFISD